MIQIRRSGERGHFDHGWLNTYHTFSFADYHDPAFMGFRSLRVINEDRVQPSVGFGKHGHRDMEIVSIVLEGELSHHDSMGNGSIIRPGDVQRMSAGTGVMHSEQNPSADTPVHFYQIWILPDRRGLAPSYEQKSFDRNGRGLQLVASRDGREGSVSLHQAVSLYRGSIDGPAVEHPFAGGFGWVQVARGEVEVALPGQQPAKLVAGDGAAIEGEQKIAIWGSGEVLLFDLS